MMLLMLGKTVSIKISVCKIGSKMKFAVNVFLIHMCARNHSLTKFTVPNDVMLNVLQCLHASLFLYSTR